MSPNTNCIICMLIGWCIRENKPILLTWGVVQKLYFFLSVFIWERSIGTIIRYRISIFHSQIFLSLVLSLLRNIISFGEVNFKVLFWELMKPNIQRKRRTFFFLCGCAYRHHYRQTQSLSLVCLFSFYCINADEIENLKKKCES